MAVCNKLAYVSLAVRKSAELRNIWPDCQLSKVTVNTVNSFYIPL